ncbi:MAG: hypothetical protein LUF34_09240 [Lachnospiraceae bacterium]|nr:hypothetical protein [Lachnospiraceae bacterium]
MNKTTESKLKDYSMLTVNTETLMAMLDCGRPTAVKISKAAGAEVQFGKRKLHLVGRVQRYLESKAEEAL